MAFSVLKPFPFAGDGHTVEWLVAGLERDDFGAATDGLVAEGFIKEIGKQDAEPVKAKPAKPEKAGD